MAGDRPTDMLTANVKTYTLKEAGKIAEKERILPYQKQRKWYFVKTGNRVYFNN